MGCHDNNCFPALNRQAKRIKIKRSDASLKRLGGELERQMMLTETVCMGDQIVLLVERSPSKLGGFIHPLSKESFKDEFKPFKEDHFNCHSNGHCFPRMSHEDNSKVPVGLAAKNGRMHFRTAILCEPAQHLLDGNGLCTVELEKEFRDTCHSILSKWCKKVQPSEAYVPWSSNHSMTANTLSERVKCKSLDMVFIDDSVGKILYDYFVPAEIEPKDVHKFLVEQGIDNVFTRKENGKFSDCAISMFDFPSDTVKTSSSV